MRCRWWTARISNSEQCKDVSRLQRLVEIYGLMVWTTITVILMTQQIWVKSILTSY